jgi:sugar-specific transcriptional regulator TrmB
LRVWICSETLCQFISRTCVEGSKTSPWDLRERGLTPSEAKAYLGLVKNGPLGANELAFLSHVSRPKVYGVLRSLRRKGLVHFTPTLPQTFTAVSPLAVLNVKAREIADQAASVLEVVQKLSEEYSLETKGSDRSGLPIEANELWHIDGRKQIYDRVGQMLRRAAKSISYYATPAGLVRAYKAHADCLETVGKRGVIVRLLAQTSKDVHFVTHELGAIAKIRRTTKPFAANFVCIDGQELVVIGNSPGDFDVHKGEDRAAWTTNKLMVQLYENLFERIWENSSPFH